jgi:BirA family biotin operon repressor/biotin-[acetyl-CoA-carboxylase] ligase
MRPLTAEVMAPLVETAWLGRAWRYVARCGSTNDEAAAWARAGAPTGAVVVASAQEAGRGRLGRRWHSPPDENLYFSVVLRPPLPPSRLPPLTLAAGVALVEAMARVDVAARLKWPNDLVVDGRKVAGLLAEMSCQGARVERVVLGIGVNVDASQFPDELCATSLRLARGAPVDGALFAASLCQRLEAWHDRFVADGAAPVVQAWRAAALPFGKRVTVSSCAERLSGVALDLDEDGALLLRLDDGRVERITAGDVV